ncbi:MAG: STAS domain-containing protein [Actinomycetota bacterium]
MDLRVNIVGESTSSCTVHLNGTCDLATAPALREALAPITPPSVTEVMLDVSDVDFMDSTGLGIVLGLLRRLREGGGSLKMIGAHGSVRRLLEITELDKVIPLV